MAVVGLWLALSAGCLPKTAVRRTEEPVVLEQWVAEEARPAVSLEIDGADLRAEAGEVRRAQPMERVQVEEWIRRDWAWAAEPRDLLLIGLPAAGAGLILTGAGLAANGGQMDGLAWAGAGVGAAGLVPLAALGVGSLMVIDTRVRVRPPEERPTGEARESFVPTGPYDGSVSVHIAATRTPWEAEGSITFAAGSPADLSGLPYLPDTARPADPVWSAADRLVLAPAPLDLYRHARTQAAAQLSPAPAPAAGRFSADHAWWETPQRFRLELLTYEVRPTRPMDGILKSMFGGAAPDVKIEFRVGDTSLGCTPPLGDDLSPGIYAWSRPPVLIVDLARADEWQISAWDQDMSDSEEIGGNPPHLGLPPEGGADGLVWRSTPLQGVETAVTTRWRACLAGI